MLSACGQVTATRGSSFVDPAYQGQMFNSIVIDTRSGNLIERENIERTAALTFEKAHVQGIPALGVVPPTRNVGESIRRRDIMNTGAQAVLEIVPLEKQIIEDYMPGTQYRDLRRGRDGHRWNRSAYWDDPFYYDPPLILHEPEARYEATLYSLPKYQKIWTADIITRGPTGMSFEEVGANFSREVVKRLAKDGLVPPVN